MLQRRFVHARALRRQRCPLGEAASSIRALLTDGSTTIPHDDAASLDKAAQSLEQMAGVVRPQEAEAGEPRETASEAETVPLEPPPAAEAAPAPEEAAAAKKSSKKRKAAGEEEAEARGGDKKRRKGKEQEQEQEKKKKKQEKKKKKKPD